MIQKDLGDHIIDLSSIASCKPLKDNSLDWNHVLKNVSLYDDNYLPPIIEYHEAYYTEKYGYFTDYSVVFYDNHQPVGVWPLCVYKQNGEYVIGTNGRVCLFPLIMDKFHDTKLQKRIIADCFKLLLNLCEEYRFPTITFELNLLLYKMGCFYEKLIMNNATIEYEGHDLYVNLELGLDTIQSKIRKSYKSIINSSRKKLNCEIIDGTCNNLSTAMQEFKNLHVSVAGRETRGQKTWDVQEKFLKASNGFIVFLKDMNQNLIGASLIIATPFTAQYAVGAYKRELFDEYALGHVTQMVVIERLNELKKKWYCLGRMPLPQDNSNPTSKEISIGMFKKGFSTDMALINRIMVTPDTLRNALK